MAKDKRAEDRQALERLLDVCGADRTRWPARERLRFASFIGEDEGAKRLLAEADALDSLLDRAPRASEARERALQERIVAAALRSSETKLAVVGGRALVPGASSLRGKLPGVRGFGFGRGGVKTEWPAAALLAASLVMGVILGSAGTLDRAVQEVAEISGYTTATETSQVALGEEIVAPVEEDLL
jgi:hypothetical protein